MQLTRGVVSSLRAAALTLGALFFLTAPASAEIYGFSCITNNNLNDCATLEAQMQVEVTAGSGTVNFLFTNVGSAASSIADVYFSDLVAPLLGQPVLITSSSGVSFSAGCSPGNLPGGNPYGFTTSYCADSNAPTQPNGVNASVAGTEWLNLAYTLQAGITFADLIAAIEGGSYRIGIHAQGFAGGGSEAGLLTGTPTGVPEPTSLMFLGLGLLLTPVVRRFRQRP